MPAELTRQRAAAAPLVDLPKLSGADEGPPPAGGGSRRATVTAADTGAAALLGALGDDRTMPCS